MSRHIGRSVLRFDELPSTNDHAATLARDPDADGCVVVARAQSAGRGRFDRRWDSPAGMGVWMSVVLRPAPEFRRPVVLTAWVAVAVARVVAASIDRPARIKWPNDILVDGRKIAGILIEQRPDVIVGIGLNVNQVEDGLTSANLGGATSLRMLTGRTHGTDQVLTSLITALDDGYESLRSGRGAEIESAWVAGLGLVGQQVTIEHIDHRRWPARLTGIGFEQVTWLDDSGVPGTATPESIAHLFDTPDSTT